MCLQLSKSGILARPRLLALHNSRHCPFYFALYRKNSTPRRSYYLIATIPLEPLLLPLHKQMTYDNKHSCSTEKTSPVISLSSMVVGYNSPIAECCLQFSSCCSCWLFFEKGESGTNPVGRKNRLKSERISWLNLCAVERITGTDD